MAKNKEKEFYFKNERAEVCRNRDFFIKYMKENNITEIEVYKAVLDRQTGVFWCKHELFCGDDTLDHCGKQCNVYTPRNGKNGRCKYHSTNIYYHGEKVKLKL